MEDRYDAYSEAGINEKGVSCSATLSTSYNEKAEEADPVTEETGIGEYNYASVILGESATAREGVELLGSLIDEQGVCSNDQIIIADNNETWLFAALSGHQWIGMKLADDVASINPNIGNLNYDVDLNDPENCLHSEGIESMPKEKALPSTPTASSTSPQPMARPFRIPVCTSGPATSRAVTTLATSSRRAPTTRSSRTSAKRLAPRPAPWSTRCSRCSSSLERKTGLPLR